MSHFAPERILRGIQVSSGHAPQAKIAAMATGTGGASLTAPIQDEDAGASAHVRVPQCAVTRPHTLVQGNAALGEPSKFLLGIRCRRGCQAGVSAETTGCLRTTCLGEVGIPQLRIQPAHALAREMLLWVHVRGHVHVRGVATPGTWWAAARPGLHWGYWSLWVVDEGEPLPPRPRHELNVSTRNRPADSLIPKTATAAGSGFAPFPGLTWLYTIHSLRIPPAHLHTFGSQQARHPRPHGRRSRSCGCLSVGVSGLTRAVLVSASWGC